MVTVETFRIPFDDTDDFMAGINDGFCLYLATERPLETPVKFVPSGLPWVHSFLGDVSCVYAVFRILLILPGFLVFF